MSWQCFLIEPTKRAEESLRRYAHGPKCPASGNVYHNAVAIIGETDLPDDEHGSGGDDFPHDDPRWPASCACGYVFTDLDPWQRNLDEIWQGGAYRGPLNNELPIGAMWDAYWLRAVDSHRGPDGTSIMVKLPCGTMWCVDGPSSDGTHWSRTGDPPLITASPSILTLGYHGFLQNGVLTDDLDGRTYP